MASEEYGNNYECIYADSFAFLLREVGTPNYVNLAVLPDGTPVSVRNINNADGCRANTEYFQGYDIGDTNYNGRTTVLTASSTVTPGVTYEIKLVVADQGDDAWDSAIFIEGGSFDIGGDLGVDRTIVNGNPGCLGTDITLDANLSATSATFEWLKDGVVIPGEVNSTLDVSTNGTYSFNATLVGSCEATDEVIIEFTVPPVITNPPEDILLCETDGNGIEVFDFSANEGLILGSQPATNFSISYHTSQENAEDNLSSITIPHQNTLVIETIWMRIADLTQSCYKVVNFDIEVRSQPTANSANDIIFCDNPDDGDDTNGVVEFDLSTKVSEVLGSQLASDYDVKFYYDQAAADAGVVGTDITNSIQNSTNPQNIFARLENKLNNDCFDTTSFQLIVNPLPVVNSEVTLKQCDTDTDGITDFNLTQANQLISSNFVNETITYYLTQAHAESGLLTDQIPTPTIYTNPTPVNSIVYARSQTNHGCFRTSKINLVVGATLLDPVAFQLEYFVCDDTETDNDNSNGIATFDFSDATDQVLAQLPTNQNLTVSYYTTEAAALAETNPIPDITKHRNTTSPNTQKIYVRVDSNDVNACLGLGHYITLKVGPLPERNTISDYILCSDINQTIFDLSSKESEILGSQMTPVLITYHLSEQLAIDNIPIPNPSTYSNISNPQTIFVRAQFDPNNNMNLDVRECVRTDMSFKIRVNLNSQLFIPDPIVECNDQVTTVYDLTLRETQITNNDPTISLTYFETQFDLDNNNPILNPTTYTSNTLSNTILVLATAVNQCMETINLELNTILYANLNRTPPPLEECEIDNNGFDYFDLTLRESAILNGLNPLDFEISYYEDEMDAELGNTNNIPDPTNFENTIILTQEIYVRVKPKLNNCFIIVPLTIIVNSVPEIDILDRYVICLNTDDQVINPVTQPFLPAPPIDTQLSSIVYSFQWYKGSIEEVDFDPSAYIIPGATSATFSPTSEGIYTVHATNIASGCRIPASTEVVSSYPPESIDVTLLSEMFSDNNKLEVTVVGMGVYEYRVDFGPWQMETLFENIPIGEHIVHVRDLLNCNEITQKKIVIGYPKFFTPNGDGYHDTWNIIGMTVKPSSKIYIFDRYGKLLKEISSTGKGWDGTFNGVQLPSTDYWFVLEYNDPVTEKMNLFRAHFTLKR
jgi:gliding motility-associated-like protein